MNDSNTILVVDDEPAGRETLAGLLLAQEYHLAFAASGIEALQQALDLRPDLILLDVMMAGMDGFEVCRRLRNDQSIGDVPIIMLTAPFDRVELRARVRTLMRLNRHRRLLAERDKLARVIEFAPDGLLIVDHTGTIVLANPAVVRMVGAQQQAELLGKQITALLSTSQGASCQAAMARVLDGSATVVRVEIALASPTGISVPVEMQIGFLRWNDRPAAQIIARDISERKQAELLEEERRQLAYELHDGLAQMVVSTHQHLQAFAARHRPRTQPTRVELDRILDLAHRSATEVRRVIAGLRPTALDDFGLATALQMQVGALQADGWDVSYQATLGAERLTPAIETVLYRVAQEALTNVRKHAQTTRVAVTLERHSNGVRLTIRDWGRGFEPAQALANTGLGQRIGLRGMHERVALLGGRWNIHSNPGAGVEITAEIPVAT